MVADPARVRVAILASMLISGCAASHDVHPELTQAYGPARVIAILPPYVQVHEHGVSDRERPDWTLAGFDNLAAALQSDFEDRGLEVAWIEETAESGPAIADVAGSVIANAPESQQPNALFISPQRRFLEHQQFYLRKAIGPLLDPVGGDLLAVVRAGGLVQTPEGQVSDFLGAMASALLLGGEGGGTKSTSSWLWIAIADRSGRVLYVGRCSDSRMLTDPDAARGMVARALAGLPKADRLPRP